MPLKWNLAFCEEIISEELEVSLGSDRRIQLAQRPGRRVPGVYKDLPTNPLLLPVQRFERFLRHHDFAAHFEILRQLVVLQQSRFNAQRNRSNGLHVWRNVLARRAVTARNTTR